jgi:hypothetical protein
MTGRQRFAARLLAAGLALAGVCLILANVDSLLGGGWPSRIVRLVAGLVLLFEGLALTLDGARPWVPPGRRLVRDLMLLRFQTPTPTLASRLMLGTGKMVLGPTLFLLGLVLVGFGTLELTRVP